MNTNSDPNCDLFYEKNATLLTRSSVTNGELATHVWFVQAAQAATVSVMVK